jgi:cytoskeleton protein RodZ
VSQDKPFLARPADAGRLPLREHRMRARVSLEEIMAETKISRRFLEAIEAGRYEELPGGVFAVNYIRQYAWMTGYDAEVILEHYRSRVEEPSPAETVRRQLAPRWVRFFESA